MNEITVADDEELVINGVRFSGALFGARGFNPIPGDARWVKVVDRSDRLVSILSASPGLTAAIDALVAAKS